MRGKVLRTGSKLEEVRITEVTARLQQRGGLGSALSGLQDGSNRQGILSNPSSRIGLLKPMTDERQNRP